MSSWGWRATRMGPSPRTPSWTAGRRREVSQQTVCSRSQPGARCPGEGDAGRAGPGRRGGGGVRPGCRRRRRGAGSDVELKEAAGGSVPAGSPTAARVILPRGGRGRVCGVGLGRWGGAGAAGGIRVSPETAGISVSRHPECISCLRREWARGEQSLATEANCLLLPKALKLAFRTGVGGCLHFIPGTQRS